jgi:hypothetical protein
MAARMAMIAMTTSNSMRVKATGARFEAMPGEKLRGVFFNIKLLFPVRPCWLNNSKAVRPLSRAG